MARSWFCYNNSTPADRLTSSNYTAVPSLAFCGCGGFPNNICAVYATISSTQPVITLRLREYLVAGGVFPFLPQPILPGTKKYVYTRPN